MVWNDENPYLHSGEQHKLLLIWLRIKIELLKFPLKVGDTNLWQSVSIYIKLEPFKMQVLHTKLELFIASWNKIKCHYCWQKIPISINPEWRLTSDVQVIACKHGISTLFASIISTWSWTSIHSACPSGLLDVQINIANSIDPVPSVTHFGHQNRHPNELAN